MQRTRPTGFSLVELLVVVAIISVLATTAIGALSEGAAVARDSKRVADMEAIETALFLFYQANGRYPNESIDGVPNTGQMIGVGNEIDTALAPYLSQVPQDPIHDAGNGVGPAGGSLYYYSYDPQHNVQTTNCSGSYTGSGGTVFGFNRSETRGVISKDTCHGPNMGLDGADYNKALYPMAP